MLFITLWQGKEYNSDINVYVIILVLRLYYCLLKWINASIVNYKKLCGKLPQLNGSSHEATL